MTTETKHMPSEREIEVATEALARSALTPKGKIECVWPDDWSHDECEKLRKAATVALTAASKSRAPDQSERIAKLEAALAEARKVIERVKTEWTAEGIRLLVGNTEIGTFKVFDDRHTAIAILDAESRAARDRLTRNPESSDG